MYLHTSVIYMYMDAHINMHIVKQIYLYVHNVISPLKICTVDSLLGRRSIFIF